MSPQEFDLIQRIRIEDGVPRVISTRIQVIEGGEDLMSLAINLLKELGFYDKFEEKRTSQYIGYKLKHPGKGAKRYQLVLQDRKEGLCISIPQEILEPHILELKFTAAIFLQNVYWDSETYDLGQIFVFPSKINLFKQSFAYQDMQDSLKSNIEEKGVIDLGLPKMYTPQFMQNFNLEKLAEDKTYIILQYDKLFPYAWQVSINCKEILEEFMNFFVPKIMEQN